LTRPPQSLAFLPKAIDKAPTIARPTGDATRDLFSWQQYVTSLKVYIRATYPSRRSIAGEVLGALDEIYLAWLREKDPIRRISINARTFAFDHQDLIYLERLQHFVCDARQHVDHIFIDQHPAIHILESLFRTRQQYAIHDGPNLDKIEQAVHDGCVNLPGNTLVEKLQNWPIPCTASSPSAVTARAPSLRMSRISTPKSTSPRSIVMTPRGKSGVAPYNHTTRICKPPKTSTHVSSTSPPRASSNSRVRRRTPPTRQRNFLAGKCNHGKNCRYKHGGGGGRNPTANAADLDKEEDKNTPGDEKRDDLAAHLGDTKPRFDYGPSKYHCGPRLAKGAFPDESTCKRIHDPAKKGINKQHLP